MDDGRISLFVSTEVSELTDQGALELTAGHVVDDNGNVLTIPGLTLPGLKVRRAETTLELPSGGSMVMAGLIQDLTKQSIDGVPGAKDVPGLGALFRARDMDSEETELVVIVTPYLVSPTSQSDLSTPADGYVGPNDLEALFLGRLNRVYAAPEASVDDHGWRGPIGFILDEGDSMPGRAGRPYADVVSTSGAEEVDGAGESQPREGGMP
jgi:pilus assembly protein CpaC